MSARAFRGAVAVLAVAVAGCFFRDECNEVPGDRCPQMSTRVTCTFDTCSIKYANGHSVPMDVVRIEQGAVLHVRTRLPSGASEIRIGVKAYGYLVEVASLSLTIAGVEATRLEPDPASNPRIVRFAVPAPTPSEPVVLDVALPDSGGVRGGMEMFIDAISQRKSCSPCDL